MWLNRKNTKENSEYFLKNHDIKDEKYGLDNAIKTDLPGNIKIIKEAMGESSDVIIREFNAGRENEVSIAAIYIDGLADKVFVQDFILKVAMLELKKTKIRPSTGEDFYKVLKDLALVVGRN